MWNLFKSDVYRLRHSRFFFVVTLLYTLMTILLVSTEGVIVSNTSFAAFDGRTSTLADYLAFLPKNAIFLFFVFLALHPLSERGIPEPLCQKHLSVLSAQRKADFRPGS